MIWRLARSKRRITATFLYLPLSFPCLCVQQLHLLLLPFWRSKIQPQGEGKGGFKLVTSAIWDVVPSQLCNPLGLYMAQYLFQEIEDYIDNSLIGVIYTKRSSCREYSAVYYIHNKVSDISISSPKSVDTNISVAIQHRYGINQLKELSNYLLWHFWEDNTVNV